MLNFHDKGARALRLDAVLAGVAKEGLLRAEALVLCSVGVAASASSP